MPPRTQIKEINSDADSKMLPTSRSANKARNAVAIAAQQEILSKHIHSNGPNDKPKIDALDFTTLNVSSLNKYNRKYALNLPAIRTLNEDILLSALGKKTYSSKRLTQEHKISKPEIASHCQKHFMASPCRENEIISNFLYKVKNEDKEFKLTF
uniref:Histone deacetylase complex subunit SAP30 Sin3 binding domain-containing protein n=1 Tax=Candidozyma auris TaxID=498019 RepID=A0A0L0NQ54_CANAR